MENTTSRKAEALHSLRTDVKIKPGETIYTILRYVSSSGMTRVIDLVVMRKNKPYTITWMAGDILGLKFDRNHRGLRISGGGMDMGYHMVYQLSSALWPKGFKCVKKGNTRCFSNDHSNGDERSHHPNGGYALGQEWL